MTMNFILILTVLLVFVLIFTWEVIIPASKNQCDKRWLLMASSINLFQSSVTVLAGIFIFDSLSQHSIFNLQHLSIIAQGGLGFLLTSFVAYWWHRAMHHFDWLWRVFHQLHHSPRRIESLSAFYLHPFDGVAASFINAICCYVVLGLSLYGTAISLLIAAIYNLFIHADLKTPFWLGFVVQRPEMHRVHHQHMHHAQNYGLAIWDGLFGTFNNPKHYVEEVGFDQERESKIFEMLSLQDVYKKK